MCGHGGMMGPGINVSDIYMMRDLAYVLGLRGIDGTGVLQGYHSGKKRRYRILKNEHEVGYFLWFNQTSSKEADNKILNDTHDTFMALHVRAATMGAVNAENAHPFEKTNIIGMHNGTLKDDQYKDSMKTDSEMMFEDMDKRGIENVLRGLSSKSAYAIVAFEKKHFEFVFTREISRPLFYAINKERKVFYWASEARMIQFAASRHGVKLKEITAFEPDHVYRFGPDDIETNREPDWDKQPLYGFQANLEARTVWGPAAGAKVIPIGNKSRLGAYPSNSNETPLRLTRNTPKGREILPEICRNCRKEMDLYDQYKGHEEPVNVYTCAECYELQYQKEKQLEIDLTSRKALN